MALKKQKREPAEGPVFEGFEHVRTLGGGGFATVYRASEIETGRSVALKVIRTGDVPGNILEAFRDEAKALGQVSSHPNIVTLYRTITDDQGHPVLVMELCHGSLGQRLRAEGPATPAAVAAVGVKIAGALETVHRLGILHRDVKPQNILVTAFDEPALADFGVARLRSSSQAVSGMFGFTTLHAPPELLQGGRMTEATDVYELASTLYLLVAGRAAFATVADEAPAAVIHRILSEPVPPLDRADAPWALSDLLIRSMHKDPGERPPTALAFAKELVAIEQAAGWPVPEYKILARPADVVAERAQREAEVAAAVGEWAPPGVKPPRSDQPTTPPGPEPIGPPSTPATTPPAPAPRRVVTPVVSAPRRVAFGGDPPTSPATAEQPADGATRSPPPDASRPPGPSRPVGRSAPRPHRPRFSDPVERAPSAPRHFAEPTGGPAPAPTGVDSRPGPPLLPQWVEEPDEDPSYRTRAAFGTADALFDEDDEPASPATRPAWIVPLAIGVAVIVTLVLLLVLFA